MRSMKRPFGIAVVSGLSALLSTPTVSMAAEDATSFYLLGSKGPMAGFVPPPGTYLSEYEYFYTGRASGQAAEGVTLNRTGARTTTGLELTLEAKIHADANALYDMPSILWIAPQDILGGHVGLGLIVPIGWKRVDADVDTLATLSLPIGITLQRGRHFDIEDSSFNFGDPIPNAVIGWHQGNWYWNLGALVNVPIGEWSKENIANIGFGRWALDTSAAVTWLDPSTGFEVSSSAGFTFNGENPDTDYKTGTEFHAEFALMEHFSKRFSIGVAGYYYDQVTGDSGAGAVLGPFEGRVTAIGPSATYAFQLGKLPLATSLRWYREFNTENRLDGDAVMLTASMPISVAGH
jgi:hypothetical protein